MDNIDNIFDRAKTHMDSYMIENGFHPVKYPDIMVNLDSMIFTYKCQKENCKYPYEIIAISGLEELQNNDKSIIELCLHRCSEKVKEHTHE